MQQYQEDHMIRQVKKIVSHCWKIVHPKATTTRTESTKRNNNYNNSNINNNKVEETNESHSQYDAMFQEKTTVRLRGIVVNELYWNLATEFLGYGLE
jgi:hypothetical protein